MFEAIFGSTGGLRPRRYAVVVTKRRAMTAEAMPRGLKIALNVMVIAGVFAMHNLLSGVGQDMQPHHTMPSMSQTMSGASHTAMTATTAVVSEAGADMQGTMSDCGGLMALCLALVLGVSAYLVVRKRLADRVLWQLPPPTSTPVVRAVPPFNARSPIERSSVLRC